MFKKLIFSTLLIFGLCNAAVAGNCHKNGDQSGCKIIVHVNPNSSGSYPCSVSLDGGSQRISVKDDEAKLVILWTLVPHNKGGYDYEFTSMGIAIHDNSDIGGHHKDFSDPQQDGSNAYSFYTTLTNSNPTDWINHHKYDINVKRIKDGMEQLCKPLDPIIANDNSDSSLRKKALRRKSRT